MSVLKNKFIDKNEFSRPGTKLHGVKKLILHYTANPGGSAENHFTYFGKSLIELNERLPADDQRFASAHIFVDKEEALCIIPLDEVAYQANDGSYRGVAELKPNANFLSVGVEMCVEKDGSFHKDTISRTEDVFAELCKKFKLDPIKDIVRHYDVTRKNCPAPWVNDGQGFVDFKNHVKKKMNPVVKANAVYTHKIHIVVKGDVVSKIAAANHTTIQQIKDWNKLDSKYTIRLGQKLRVK